MKFYRGLSLEELKSVEGNKLVYLSRGSVERRPVMSLLHKRGGEDAFFVADTGDGHPIVVGYSYATYGTNWRVEVEDGFCVDTPDGVLYVHHKRDPEYPGAIIDLVRDEQPVPTTLAMTEYVPGDEGLCGFDPMNPALSLEEIREVPRERLIKDGQPVFSEEYISPATAMDYRISSGLVTRGWPNELADVDYHKRIFHFGYKK